MFIASLVFDLIKVSVIKYRHGMTSIHVARCMMKSLPAPAAVHSRLPAGY